MEKQWPCPSCGAAVVIESSCPGYPNGNGRVMVCYPYCGGALEYRCECGWWYRDPVGYRSIVGMALAPEWLTEARAYYDPTEDDDAPTQQ